jgi:hypothetical protein
MMDIRKRKGLKMEPPALGVGRSLFIVPLFVYR